MRNEVLDTIDSISGIESTVIESVIDVYDALTCEYSKICIIMDHYDGNDTSQFSIFQEGEIFDKATGKKNVGESMIKKIIWFVPRLLGAIVSAISSIFTKKNKDEITEDIKNCEKIISDSSDTELAVVANKVNAASNNEINFEPKSKKFTFKGKMRHIKNTIIMAGTFGVIMKKIKTACKSENVPYRALAQDLKDVLTKNKDVDAETVAYSISTIKEMVDDSFVVSLGLKSACEEVSSLLEKKMQKDFGNNKDTAKLAEAKELVDRIRDVSDRVKDISGFGLLMKKMFGSIAKRAMHNSMYADKYDEINELKVENKKLKNVKKELKEEQKLEQQLQNEKKKNRKLRDKNQEAVEKNEKKLEKQRDRHVEEDIKYDTMKSI